MKKVLARVHILLFSFVGVGSQPTEQIKVTVNSRT